MNTTNIHNIGRLGSENMNIVNTSGSPAPSLEFLTESGLLNPGGSRVK